MNNTNKISELDILHLTLIRNNVKKLIQKVANTFDTSEIKVLDIAPQDYLGAKEFFTKAKVYSLDIDPHAHADFTADICSNNSSIIEDNFFDIVICTEVLEHTLQPFNAVNELFRITKPNGIVCCSTPYNFRIHGPLPDCWRFTEYGLRELFKNFANIQIDPLETEDRFLMPIHYTIYAKK